MTKLQIIQKEIDGLTSEEKGLINDSFHSISELYEFRKLYNAALFNEWAQQTGKTIWHEDASSGRSYPVVSPKYDVHKSWRHHDGEKCFGGGWFIVVAVLPSGQISNHYKAEDWDLFRIPAYDRAKYEFDGHSPADVLERLKTLNNGI